MRIVKTSLLSVLIFTITSCASGYKMIEPKSINYISKRENNGVILEYKYGLLEKKYEKKELKKGVKLVAVKVTNNLEKDLVFGRDIRLVYENDSEIYILDNETTFKRLKQIPASYLWYLLLTPVNFTVQKVDHTGIHESSTPIGLFIGPGLTGGNMIAAGAANKKFKEELLKYNINGTIIKKGETKYGLIGIENNSFEALKLKIE